MIHLACEERATIGSSETQRPHRLPPTRELLPHSSRPEVGRRSRPDCRDSLHEHRRTTIGRGPYPTSKVSVRWSTLRTLTCIILDVDEGHMTLAVVHPTVSSTEGSEARGSSDLESRKSWPFTGGSWKLGCLCLGCQACQGKYLCISPMPSSHRGKFLGHGWRLLQELHQACFILADCTNLEVSVELNFAQDSGVLARVFGFERERERSQPWRLWMWPGRRSLSWWCTWTKQRHGTKYVVRSNMVPSFWVRVNLELRKMLIRPPA